MSPLSSFAAVFLHTQLGDVSDSFLRAIPSAAAKPCSRKRFGEPPELPAQPNVRLGVAARIEWRRRLHLILTPRVCRRCIIGRRAPRWHEMTAAPPTAAAAGHSTGSEWLTGFWRHCC